MRFIKVTVQEREQVSLADPVSVDCAKCGNTVELDVPAEPS